MNRQCLERWELNDYFSSCISFRDGPMWDHCWRKDWRSALDMVGSKQISPGPFPGGNVARIGRGWARRGSIGFGLPDIVPPFYVWKCQPILSQAFSEAAPDSTPAVPQIEEKGTTTAGVGSSVARSDRSVPQARLQMTFIAQCRTHCPNVSNM